jgi:hypothetical protein
MESESESDGLVRNKPVSKLHSFGKIKSFRCLNAGRQHRAIEIRRREGPMEAVGKMIEGG